MRAGPSSAIECIGVDGVTGVIGDIKGESSEVVDEDASETSVPLDEAEASDVSDRLELLVDDRDVNFRRGAGGSMLSGSLEHVVKARSATTNLVLHLGRPLRQGSDRPPHCTVPRSRTRTDRGRDRDP